MTIKARLERAETRAGIGAAVHVVALCNEGTAGTDDPQPYIGWAGNRTFRIAEGQTHADFARELLSASNGGGVSYLDDDARQL
jgi:hypothetical protein